MIDRVLDWVERHYVPASLMAIGALVLLLALTFASLASAAPRTVSYTLPTQYEDGTPLPVASIKHVRVEVGTCSAPSVFGTAEGSALVVPPATSAAVEVARAFGTFCARAQTETVSGTLSAWSATATTTITEPKPKPPVIQAVGGWAWEMKPNGDLKFVGTIDAGKPCLGLSPQIGPDLFAVNRDDVRWERGASPRSTIVAQCEVHS